MISYLAKKHKQNLNANPALRIMVKIFDDDKKFKVANDLLRNVDIKIMVCHLIAMINEDDE
jgi:hypothetical protein